MTKLHITFKKGSITYVGEKAQQGSIEVSSLKDLLEFWNKQNLKKGSVRSVLDTPVGKDFVNPNQIEYFKDLLEGLQEKISPTEEKAQI